MFGSQRCINDERKMHNFKDFLTIISLMLTFYLLIHIVMFLLLVLVKVTFLLSFFYHFTICYDFTL